MAKISKTTSCFFEKINKTDRPLGRTRKKVTKIKNEIVTLLILQKY